MVQRTIDLRNQDAAPPAQKSIPKKEGAPPLEIRAMPLQETKENLFEWTALEYPMRERGPYWWLPPSAVTLACVLFALLVKSYLFGGFAVLALLVALLYAQRPPREYRFAISREGVYIGGAHHRFSELKSFWIFEHGDAPEMSLETASGRIFPYLYIPLGDTHPNRIRRVLSDFLPEKEHTELFTDHIARSIGF